MSFLSTLGDVLSAGASFIPGIGGPIASALGNVVSKQGARQEQQELNAAQFQFSHDEAQVQRDFQERMMDKANLYNSPANQIKLMQEAGINPNTFNTGISGSVTAGTGAAASSPAGLGMPSLVASQARLAEAQAEKANTESEIALAKSPFEIDLLKVQKKYQDVQIRGVLSEIKVNKAHEQEYLASATNLYASANNFNQAVQESISRSEYLQQESTKAYHETERIKYENARQEDYWNAKIAALVSESEKNLAEKGLYLKNKELVQEQIINAIKTGKNLDVQFDISDGTKDLTIQAYNAENNKIILDSQADTAHWSWVAIRSLMRGAGSLFGSLGSGIRAAALAIPK